MEGWRLLKTKHAAHAFDGEGARLYGGRWNSPGGPCDLPGVEPGVWPF